MTSILLIFSLVLNIIALFAVVLLYLRQNRLLQLEKKQDKIMNEMEEFFSGCILEFKEENESFISRLQELGEVEQPRPIEEQRSTAGNAPDRRSKPIQKKKKAVNDNLRQHTAVITSIPENDRPKGNVYQAVQAYKNIPILEQEKDLKQTPASFQENTMAKEEKNEPPLYEKDLRSSNLYIQSLLNQALLLQKQGLSLDEIAKMLNKGKTEIELLFKFRQKG